MKKQTNLSAAGRKLSLNKKTISNLTKSEMDWKVGGNYTIGKCHWTGHYCNDNTKNGKTCPGHNTCYTC